MKFHQCGKLPSISLTSPKSSSPIVLMSLPTRWPSWF